MERLNRWWIRVLLYGGLIVFVGWVTYRLAYRYYAGPHPDDSDADLGFFYGVIWAAGLSAVAMFALALVEGLLWWRRNSVAALRDRKPSAAA